MKTIQVRVKPQSKTLQLELLPDGTYVARLRAPPVDGRANEELVALLAGHFGVRKSEVEILSGISGRIKRVRVG